MLRNFQNFYLPTKKNFGIILDWILNHISDHTLIFIHWLLIHLILLILIHHALITTWYIDFNNWLQDIFFIFTQKLLLYYAVETIELMTHQVVSFEKVLHWTKFLAFESQKFLSLKCFMKALKNRLVEIYC